VTDHTNLLPRPAHEYDRDAMIALLIAGAAQEGYLPVQAAIHLITFTDLPGTAEFARHVTVEDRWSMAQRTIVRGAWINGWNALARVKDLGTTNRHMIELAASLAVGRRVSLLEHVTGELGAAHAKRLAEAILIRCGAEKFYLLHSTDALAELEQMRRELSGEPTGLDHLQGM
jgi:hypothetical protein